jgi:hypothetical protein
VSVPGSSATSNRGSDRSIVGIVGIARLAPVALAVGFGLVLAGAAGGCLLAAESRAELGNGIGPAIAAHPGGLLVGIAILRGFAHADVPLAEDTVARMLSVGVPGLALASMLGGLIGEPFRGRFVGDALGAAVVFIAATVLALAVTRLDAIGSDAGFDWRRNPRWLLVTVAILLGAIVLALPLSTIAGRLIAVVISVALGPMLIVGLAMGFDRTARRVLIFFVVALGLAYLLASWPANGLLPGFAAPGGGPETPSTAEQLVAFSIGGLLLVVAAIAILILIAVWMRRTPPQTSMAGEIRTIDRAGDEGDGRRPRRWFGRRSEPTTAVAAYVALIEDLEGHPDARRGAGETPAAHAARLRGGDGAGLSLDFLAADYALARYGAVALPDREDRRAIARWRRLRRSLLRRPIPGAAGHAAAADPDRPEDVDVRRTL